MHEITISQELKKFYKGTLDDYTHFYKALRLRTPSTMIFDTSTTCLYYLNDLKPYITSQVNFSCCVNPQDTYNEAENTHSKA